MLTRSIRMLSAVIALGVIVNCVGCGEKANDNQQSLLRKTNDGLRVAVSPATPDDDAVGDNVSDSQLRGVLTRSGRGCLVVRLEYDQSATTLPVFKEGVISDSSNSGNPDAVLIDGREYAVGDSIEFAGGVVWSPGEVDSSFEAAAQECETRDVFGVSGVSR